MIYIVEREDGIGWDEQKFWMPSVDKTCSENEFIQKLINDGSLNEGDKIYRCELVGEIKLKKELVFNKPGE